MRRTCLLLTLLFALLGQAGIAVADVRATGNGEPAYTRPIAPNRNTWHFTWNARGTRAYFPCVQEYEGSQHIDGLCYYRSASGPTPVRDTGNGPCLGNLTEFPNGFGLCERQPVSVNGTPSNGVLVIGEPQARNGTMYTMCGSGYELLDGFYVNLSPLTDCSRTIIDEGPPSIRVSINGNAATTRDPVLRFRIDYADQISPPWFGADGRASNWTCVAVGAACTPTAVTPACSAPNVPLAQQYPFRGTYRQGPFLNSFDCQLDGATQLSNGTYYFCAKAADGAVADNPSGSDQFVATSAQANVSAVQCDSIRLDRPPAPASWQRLPGAGRDLGVPPDGAAWLVGRSPVPGGNRLHRWTGSAWATVPGGAVDVDVDSSGRAWIVNSAGAVFRRDGSRWQQLPGAGRAVSLGADGSAWLIGRRAVAGGYPIHRWTGSAWATVPGAAVSIDVDESGRAWIVNGSGAVFRRDGSQWQRLPGTGRAIGVGADGSAWLIGRRAVTGGGTISRWTGSGWVTVPGGAVSVDVDGAGRPWIVNSSGSLFRRTSAR